MNLNDITFGESPDVLEHFATRHNIKPEDDGWEKTEEISGAIEGYDVTTVYRFRDRDIWLERNTAEDVDWDVDPVPAMTNNTPDPGYGAWCAEHSESI